MKLRTIRVFVNWCCCRCCCHCGEKSFFSATFNLNLTRRHGSTELCHRVCVWLKKFNCKIVWFIYFVNKIYDKITKPVLWFTQSAFFNWVSKFFFFILLKLHHNWKWMFWNKKNWQVRWKIERFFTHIEIILLLCCVHVHMIIEIKHWGETLITHFTDMQTPTMHYTFMPWQVRWTGKNYMHTVLLQYVCAYMIVEIKMVSCNILRSCVTFSIYVDLSCSICWPVMPYEFFFCFSFCFLGQLQH